MWPRRRWAAATLVMCTLIGVTLVILHLRDGRDARATNPYFQFLGIIERPIEKSTPQSGHQSAGSGQWQSSKYLARMSYVNSSDKPMAFAGRRRGNALEVTVLHQYFEHRPASLLIPRKWRGRPEFLAVGTILLDENDEIVAISPQDAIILLVPLDRLLVELCSVADVEIRMLLYFPPYSADSVSAPFQLPKDFKSDIQNCGK